MVAGVKGGMRRELYWNSADTEAKYEHPEKESGR